MKLKELLFERFGYDKPFPTDQFGKLELELIKEELLKCDEFSMCEGIEFMEFPVHIIDQKTYTSQTMKLADDTKFIGKVYLYNVSFTPEMFDPNTIHTPVKDGAAITPVLYDPMTFQPKKKIVLEFSPEGLIDKTSDYIKKQEIKDLLEKVLQYPEEYQIKGEKGVLVRGVFKTAQMDETPFLVGEEFIPENYMAFYIEKVEKDGETSLDLKQKQIPARLKDEFIKRFTNGGAIATVTTEEIENFINENTKEN